MKETGSTVWLMDMEPSHMETEDRTKEPGKQTRRTDMELRNIPMGQNIAVHL